jgi:hypothetical protein
LLGHSDQSIKPFAKTCAFKSLLWLKGEIHDIPIFFWLLNRVYKCLVELCFRETKHTFSTKKNFQRGQEKLSQRRRYAYCLILLSGSGMRLHLLNQNATTCKRSSKQIMQHVACSIRPSHICNCQAEHVEERLIRIPESPTINKVLRTVSQQIRIRNSKLFF